LGWLHRLLQWQIALTRHTYGAEVADDAYRGLYISDAEVERLHAFHVPIPEAFVQQRTAIFQEWQAIEAQGLHAHQTQQPIPLLHLAQLFGLGPIERATLLLALAPELDLRFERLYGYIQDDVTRKRPTVDLALRLFCADPRERIAARPLFSPHAPLLQHRLIQLSDEPQRPQSPLLARAIRLDDRVVAALLGQGMFDPLLAPALRLLAEPQQVANLLLPPELVASLRRFLEAHPAGATLALHGSYGTGRRAIAAAFSHERQQPLLLVDLAQLTTSQAQSDPRDLLERVVREARLWGANLLWSNLDATIAEDGPPAWRQALLHTLRTPGLFHFLALERSWESRGLLGAMPYLRVELPTLNFSERELLWQQRLGAHAPAEPLISALASTFRLSAGQIRDAAAMAQTLAAWNGGPLSSNELFAACRAQSSGKLDALAHKIRTTYSWNDIVIPPDQLAQLHEICVQVRHRRTVLEQWGFDRHLAMGKGVNVLFAGQSGTGKTMAAEIIAADLGLELFRVDLATMVSKYIGETEKNLDRVFTAAREANAILFFDEADAIFGKRSEVKDAHDRYANIEVGYLLQKMESYDGVVILATNLKKNLDEAFVRRLHTTIDFPFPEEPDRLRIWRKVFPADAPLGDDVDLGFLARQFKLAGGNIRNIALLAAYLAAEDGTVITMPQIVRAIRREYQKLGKLLTEADFGAYYNVVREPARNRL
jgi:AAA+ superfamily predicted ATPase